MIIGIIDYGVGNIRSIHNSIYKLADKVEVVENPHEIKNCDKIVLPGTGSYASSIKILKNNHWFDEIKEFVKNLSSKLYDWTQDRWIITLTKTKGMPSKKEKENNLKKELIKNTKESAIHKNILEIFSDAELTDVIVNEEENRND